MDSPDQSREPHYLDDPQRDIVSLWSLRLLSRMRPETILDGVHCYTEIAQLLSSLEFLSELPLRDNPSPSNRMRLKTQIAKQQRALEGKYPAIANPLKSNLELLAVALDLSKAEMKCLGFCT